MYTHTDTHVHACKYIQRRGQNKKKPCSGRREKVCVEKILLLVSSKSPSIAHIAQNKTQFTIHRQISIDSRVKRMDVTILTTVAAATTDSIAPITLYIRAHILLIRIDTADLHHTHTDTCIVYCKYFRHFFHSDVNSCLKNK